MSAEVFPPTYPNVDAARAAGEPWAQPRQSRLEAVVRVLTAAEDEWSMDGSDDGRLVCPCGEKVVDDDAMAHWATHVAPLVLAALDTPAPTETFDIPGPLVENRRAEVARRDQEAAWATYVPVVETCFLCGPEARERLAAVSKDDSIALCNGHWNRWLINFVGPYVEGEPPCSAHVIQDPYESTVLAEHEAGVARREFATLAEFWAAVNGKVGEFEGGAS